MKLVVALILMLVVAGCAVSGQKFVDDTWVYEVTKYSPEGNIILEESTQWQTVRGKNRTMAPPFQSKAVAGHNLDMSQEGESWSVQMGSNSDLEGGDITAAIEALEKAMMQGVLEAIKGGL